MCGLWNVQWFSEGGDVADGCEEQGKFVDFVFGFAEEVEVCEGVVEDGNVVITFCEGGQFGCEREGEACEVSGSTHERIVVESENFVHDDVGGEIEGERDGV